MQSADFENIQLEDEESNYSFGGWNGDGGERMLVAVGGYAGEVLQGGMPGDDDATVWQCRTEEGKIFNFVVKNDSTVIFVNNI